LIPQFDCFIIDAVNILLIITGKLLNKFCLLTNKPKELPTMLKTRLHLFVIILTVSLITACSVQDSSYQIKAIIPKPIEPKSATLTELLDDDYDLASAELAVEFAAGETDDPAAADRWFWEQRASPTNHIPVLQHNAAVQAELNNPDRNPPSRAGWEELGPAPLNDITFAGQSVQDASGRMLTIAVHPTNANIVLAGAAQGGIWRSTDGGASYTSVSDNMPTLAIKAIRFATSNPNIVYAGTGEPHASTSIYGRGVLKSTDGGLTWTQLPISGATWNFEYASVAGLQVSSTNPNILFAATAHISTVVDAFQPPSTPTTGIYKSTNGGQTWTLSKAATLYDAFPTYLQGNVGFLDLEMAQSNPNLLYAAELFGGIWKTINGGSTWTRITPMKANGTATFPATVSYYSIPNANTLAYERFDATAYTDVPDFSRIELGLAQSDPNVLYAGYATNEFPVDVNSNGQYDARIQAGLLFKTTDGGTSWTWLGDLIDNVPNYCASQCDYDNMVVVNPTNANDVVIGGNANYSRYRPDPVTAPTSYYDKGWTGMVNRTLDGGANWIDIAPHCTNNGAPAGPDNMRPCLNFSPSKVTHPDIHDAAYSGNNIYIASDGGIYRTVASGNATVPLNYTWSNLNAGLSTIQFYFFDIHPTNPDIMLGGLQDNSMAYMNGTTWEGWGFGDGIFGAFDPVNPDYVYFASPNAIFRHDSGGAKAALDLSGNLINGWQQVWPPNNVQALFITPFEIDPIDTEFIYAGAANGVYESPDRGVNWSQQISTSGYGIPTSISLSPANNALVWSGSSGGAIQLRDDFGNPFVYYSSGVLPTRYVTKVEASPNNEDVVYFTYSGYASNTPSQPGKVYKITKGASGWSNVGVDDLTGDLPDVPVSAFAVDPDNENTMWVGTDVGVFMTTNGGTTWQSIRGTMPVVAIMDMKYDNAHDTLWVVTHGRGAWRFTLASVPTSVTLDVLTLARTPQAMWLIGLVAILFVGTVAILVRRRIRRAV
jgi:photosystem II stability/assembly factor-like uncharacterized protein